MSQTLMFWKPGPDLMMPAAAITQELQHGEDVAGLIDLPVKAIIDRLKAEFPRHNERAGQLTMHDGDGRLEASWTWQFVRIDLHDVPAEARARAIDVLEEFGCLVFEG